jgi:hypothetical protein
MCVCVYSIMNSSTCGNDLMLTPLRDMDVDLRFTSRTPNTGQSVSHIYLRRAWDGSVLVWGVVCRIRVYMWGL